MKKNHILIFLLIFVLSFLVLPPVVFQFFQEKPKEFIVYYPASVFLTGFFSIFIYYLSIKGQIFEKPVSHERKPFFIYSSNSLICFGTLCLSSVFFEGLSYSLKIDSGIQKVVFPDSVFGFINFFFGVIFAAFSEEVIYRFFLPPAFNELLSKKLSKYPRLWILYEGIPLMLFSLGHLYLGFFGFLNALFCGFALRFCMIKTKSLWIPFVIHSAYNFLSFGAMFLISK